MTGNAHFTSRTHKLILEIPDFIHGVLCPMLWEPIPCLEIEIPLMECQVPQLQHQVPFWDILILYTECQLPCLRDQVPHLRQPTPMTETPD